MYYSLKSPFTGPLKISPDCKNDLWIIDTDCGVDDAQAVFLCLKYCNVQAFIASSGNTPRQNVIVNLLKCLKVANKNVPIWLGAERPMLREPMYIPDIHGKDGLGDAKDYQTMENLPKQCVCGDQNGIQKLTEFINKNPNRIHYIVVGPLTTLATAILLDRSIAKKLKAFYSMGGSYKGQGNMAPQRPTVEYNFGADPVATRICLQQIPKTVLCTWELVREFNHGGSQYQSLIFDQNYETCKFFRAINGIFLRPESESGGNFQYCDGLSAVVAIFPDAIEQQKSVYGQIDSDSQKCAGALLCDWYGMCKKGTNIDVVVKINELKAFTLLQRALKGLQDDQSSQESQN